MRRQECGSNAMVTVQMTVEEYLEMKSRQETKEVTTKQKNLVYGLEGIKTLFGCSTTTAWRIKNSEWIRPAISQVGRKIVVDADLALELANGNTQRVTYRKSPPNPSSSTMLENPLTVPCVNVFLFVCLNVSVRQYISMFNKVIQGTFSLQILPLFRPKTLRNHAIFQDFKTPLLATVSSER